MFLHCKVTYIIDVGNFWAQIGSAMDFDEFRALECAITVYCNSCRQKQGYSAPLLASLHNRQTVFVPLVEHKLQHTASQQSTGLVWCRAQIQQVDSVANKTMNRVDAHLVDYGWSQVTDVEWIVTSCPQWMLLLPAFARQCWLAPAQQPCNVVELWRSMDVVTRFHAIVTTKKLFAQLTPPPAGCCSSEAMYHGEHVSLWAAQPATGDDGELQEASGASLQLIASLLLPPQAVVGGSCNTSPQFAGSGVEQLAAISNIAAAKAPDSTVAGHLEPSASSGGIPLVAPQLSSSCTGSASEQKGVAFDEPPAVMRQGAVQQPTRLVSSPDVAARGEAANRLHPESLPVGSSHVATTRSPIAGRSPSPATASLTAASGYALIPTPGMGRGLPVRGRLPHASPVEASPMIQQASAPRFPAVARAASPSTLTGRSSPSGHSPLSMPDSRGRAGEDAMLGYQSPSVDGPGLSVQGRPGSTAALATKAVGRGFFLRELEAARPAAAAAASVGGSSSPVPRPGSIDEAAGTPSLEAAGGREQPGQLPYRQPFPFTEMGEDEEVDSATGVQPPHAVLDCGQLAATTTDPVVAATAAAPAGQQSPTAPPRFGEQSVCVACGSTEHRRCGKFRDLFVD